MMKFFYNRNGIKPFRIGAAALLILLIIEIIGILNTPTYDEELEQAKLKFLKGVSKYDSYY